MICKFTRTVNVASGKTQTVEHMHLPREQLSRELWRLFPNGACVVCVDEKPIRAYPATATDTKELSDLLEQERVDEVAALRKELAHPWPPDELSDLFFKEMQEFRARSIARQAGIKAKSGSRAMRRARAAKKRRNQTKNK